MTTSEIMTIGELIDSAFGDPERNVVHHKLVQAILFLLARQLRLLDRRVKLELFANADFYSSESSILVSEVKIHANVKKRRRASSRAPGSSRPSRVSPPRPSVAGQGKGAAVGDAREAGRGGTTPLKDRASIAQGRTGSKQLSTTPSGRMLSTISGKTITTSETADLSVSKTQRKSTTGKQVEIRSKIFTAEDQSISSREKISIEKSSEDKSSTEKSSTEKSSTEKSSTEKSSTEKSSTEKSTTDKSSTGETTTEPTSSQKSSTEKSKSSTDKTSTESPTEKTTTSLDRTSSYDKTTTEMSTTEKTTSSDKSADKTSTEKSSTDKSTTEKSSDKSTTEKSTTEKSTTDKSSTSKSTTDKSSSAKTTTTSTDKTTTELSSDKTTTEKTTTSSSTKDTTTSSSGKHARRHRRGLSEFEMQRERELRIIHQRTDSRDENEKSPTPMASMDSVEVQYEKLLVVERVPSEEARARAGRLQGEVRGAAPRLSIVTQEEFSKLATVVRKLQQKFDPVGAAEFPENIQLMQELRKGASLTDAMAALQLSARLEAAERALQRMTGIVTDLASKYPDVDLTAFTQTEPETEVLYHGAPAPSSQMPPTPSKMAAVKSSKSRKSKASVLEQPALDTISDIALATQDEKEQAPGATAVEPEEEKENPDWITADELDTALQQLYDTLYESLNTIINKNKTNADSALRMANRLETKLNASLDLGTRMIDLESLVAQYADQVNTLDTGLSSQMTDYQEQLTQMQHELETGLENMAEALANTGGDTTAVAELNGHFTNLQMDFETTNTRQNELRDIQTALRTDLADLRREIELLRGTKSDRDEVADALRDKVGLGTLNGLVSLAQFDAVRGDLEQRIGAAYDKFNNQEMVWQKAIDDLLRELSEKADWSQVVFLRDDIQNNIDKLKDRLRAMLDIVGEPQAAAVARKLHRDSNCLSCSTPAYMHLEENMIPLLPGMPSETRPQTLGAESPPVHEDVLCYPGFPIPHPIDPKAHICNRYCGGSHTKIPTTLGRAPPGMIISPAGRGVDVKPDEKGVRKPCLPCNVKPKATNNKGQKRASHVGSEIHDSIDSPGEFCLTPMQSRDSIDVTPPARADED